MRILFGEVGGAVMDCWHCTTDLIWGGDHELDDNDEFVIETNLHCPECQALVFVYLPRTP